MDGTHDTSGSISEEAWLHVKYKRHTEKTLFKVCDLKKNPVTLGYTWLTKHNLKIDWNTGSIQFTRCPGSCNMAFRQVKKEKKTKVEWKYKTLIEEVEDEDEEICTLEEE